MFGIFGNSTDSVCLAGNSVAQITTVDFTEVQIVSGSHAGKETVQYFVGISPSQMNITTGVTTFQTFHFHFEEEISGRNFHLFICKFCNGVNASGTADKDFPFIFRIEVQKNITAHKAFLQGESSGKPRFFVYCKQTFQRTMFNAVVSQNSQFGSYTDTVVGSEGSAFGFQPFTVYFRFDGIGEEVMLNVIVLFAHHVDM